MEQKMDNGEMDWRQSSMVMKCQVPLTTTSEEFGKLPEEGFIAES